MQKAIALAQLEWIAGDYVIRVMQTIDETRRQRLEELIVQHGSIASLNEALGYARTDATLSQIRNRSPHSRTGKPRTMGDDVARSIEQTLNLPVGWMDTPPGLQDLSDHRLAHVVRIMESMPEHVRDQAVKIIATLAEPPRQGNGTHG